MTAQTLAELLAEHYPESDHIGRVNYCTCDGWFEGEWAEHLAAVIEAWQTEQTVWEYAVEGQLARALLTPPLVVGESLEDAWVQQERLAELVFPDPPPRILRRPVVEWEVAP